MKAKEEQLSLWAPAPKIFYQYFLLISPAFEVKEKVRALKRKLHERIGITNENLRSVPHISLMLIPSSFMCDAEIASRVQEVLRDCKSFGVSIGKAEHFEHTYTSDLILKLEDPSPVKEVFSSLCREFSSLNSEPDFVPHITIARGIRNTDFEKVKPHKDKFDCIAKFKCEGVTILRREAKYVGGRFIPLSTYTKIHEVALD